LALKQLENCIAKHVTLIPESDHVPKGQQGVRKDVWRMYLEMAGIINKDGNPREQLRRIIVTLREHERIGVWGDYVWLVNLASRVT
jgi:hypothetical protein